MHFCCTYSICGLSFRESTPLDVSLASSTLVNAQSANNEREELSV